MRPIPNTDLGKTRFSNDPKNYINQEQLLIKGESELYSKASVRKNKK